MNSIRFRCRACSYGSTDSPEEHCSFCGDVQWGCFCSNCATVLDDVFCPRCGGLGRPVPVSLGAVMQGQRPRFEAILRNGGAGAITIRFQPTAEVKLDSDQLHLAGHASGHVHGQLDTSSLGLGRQRIAVTLDGPYRHVLNLDVEVLAPLRVEAIPERLHLEKQIVGRANRATLRVVNHGPGVYRAEVRFRGEGLQVKPTHIVVKAGQEKTLQLRLTCPTTGMWRGQIDLVHDFVPLRVPIDADVIGGQLGPTRRQNLRRLPRGLRHKRSFGVANVGVRPMVVQITSTVNWLQPLTRELTLNPGRRRKLSYQVDLTEAHAGPREGEILLTSSVGNAQVPISLIVTDPEGMLAPLSPIELGHLASPVATPFEVPITNTGTGTLRGTLPQMPAWLRLEPTSLEVRPGETLRLQGSVDVLSCPRGTVEQMLPLRTTGGTGRLLLRFDCILPQIKMPGSIHLLGTAGDPSRCVLPVMNSGLSALEGQIQSSVDWVFVSPQQLRLEPGEQVEVRIEADTQGRPLGDSPFALKVETNGWQGTVPGRLTITTARGRLAPVSPIQLGAVPTPQPMYREFELRNEGEQALTITTRAGQPWLSVSPAQLRIPPRGQAKVRVDVRPGQLPGGNHRGEIHLAGEGESVVVPVLVNRLVPKFRAPDDLDLGRVETGMRKSLPLTINNPTQRPLRISVQCAQQGIEVSSATLHIAPGNSQELSVLADLTGWVPGPHSFAVHLKDEFGARHDIACAVDVQAAKSHALRINPASLRSVTLRPGQARTVPLRLRWEGRARLDIPEQRFDGPIQVHIPATHLEPGSTVTLPLELRPTPTAVEENVVALDLRFHPGTQIQPDAVPLRVKIRRPPDDRLVFAAFLMVTVFGLLVGLRYESWVLATVLTGLLGRLLARLWTTWTTGLGGDLAMIVTGTLVFLLTRNLSPDWFRACALGLPILLVSPLTRGRLGWPRSAILWAIVVLAVAGGIGCVIG